VDKERDMTMRIETTFPAVVEGDDGKGCTDGSTALPGSSARLVNDGVDSYRAADVTAAVPDADGKGCTDGSTGVPLGKPRGGGSRQPIIG
jgi:hypothetical protein